MSTASIDACWDRIGVQGDKSCQELRRHIHCRNCPKFVEGAHALLDRPPPEGYVEEWTMFLARAKEVEAGVTDAVMVFRIGTEWLALDAGSCVEIVAVRQIRRVPHRSGRIFIGLANVRGELRLCFSLANLLGMEAPSPATANAPPRLVVARKERFILAFPVDEVMGLHRFHRDDIRPIPATVMHAVPQFSRGMLTVDGRRIGLFDDELLFHALARVLE